MLKKMSREVAKRGALIVFEGCDRSGKSTQCGLLAKRLRENGVDVQELRFPDRTTPIGKVIEGYLSKKEKLSDRAIHLLFSANRWEWEPKMRELLSAGTTLIIDRYSFSGVAYSAAKQGLDMNWCSIPEIGLPKPDMVIFMSLPFEVASQRKGYGEEIYECQAFQKSVHDNYMKMKDESWIIVDGEKKIETVHEDLLRNAMDVINKVKDRELRSLWEGRQT